MAHRLTIPHSSSQQHIPPSGLENEALQHSSICTTSLLSHTGTQALFASSSFPTFLLLSSLAHLIALASFSMVLCWHGFCTHLGRCVGLFTPFLLDLSLDRKGKKEGENSKLPPHCVCVCGGIDLACVCVWLCVCDISLCAWCGQTWLVCMVCVYGVCIMYWELFGMVEAGQWLKGFTLLPSFPSLTFLTLPTFYYYNYFLLPHPHLHPLPYLPAKERKRRAATPWHCAFLGTFCTVCLSIFSHVL